MSAGGGGNGSSMRLKGVVFDWAGTLVDFGSLAPMGVFVEVFARFGMAITVAEARAFMGLPKRDHIARLLAMPRIAEAFEAAHGRKPDERDIDAIYDAFLPENVAVIPRYAEPVPGAAECLRTLRGRGLKLGSTTGYTREIMAVLVPIAAREGVVLDNLVCAGDLPWGRPTPMMMYRCFLELGLWPAAAVVKVDDTAFGLAEGLGAGTWTIGVAVSGNAFGLPRAECERLSAAEFGARRQAAASSLAEAGAHLVIDTVADLLPALARIEERLAAGFMPHDGPLGP